MSYASRFSLPGKITLKMSLLLCALFAPQLVKAQSVLFVTSSVPMTGGDSAAAAALAGLGYAVDARAAAAVATGDTAGKALVVISSSVTSADVNTKFRTVPKPVVTWESALFDDLGMVSTAAGQYGTTAGQTQLAITTAGHRLAAGLTGTQSVFTSADPISWGIVPTTAAKIATQVGDATHAAIFGYDVGNAMSGMNAPGRRVGFFLGDTGPSKWTAQGSSLFRAAILWAAGVSDPWIKAQPQSLTVNIGQTATFAVVAQGSGTITAQWKKNGVNIAGATSLSYTTPAVVAADSGAVFTVAITGANGTTTSVGAVLTVLRAPVIVVPPAPQTVAVGQPATFSVTATGAAPLSYQWRKNSANIGGATSPAYTTPPATAADNGAQFSVVVSNGIGSVTSPNAALTVGAPPVITSQPANATVILGQPATFTIAATPAPLTYQWRKNGANIGGATGPSYTSPPTTAGDSAASFSCVVTNAFGSVTSANAFIILMTPPVIITQPANVSVPAGSPATFSILAGGSAPLAYQWRKNGANIGGATAPSYTTPPTTPADSGAAFTCQVSNPAGSIVSNIGRLTVTAPLLPPAITGQPASVTAIAGTTIALTVTATGSAPLTFQWRKDSTVVGTAATLVLANITAAQAGNYTVTVANSAGSVTSNTAVVTVVPAGTSFTKDWLTITGELFDMSGNPVGPAPGAPVPTDMEIRLYTDPAGGTAVYAETFFAANGKAVPVADGFFAARLGQGTTTGNLAAVIANNPSLYAEILIGSSASQDILAPRTPLTASPFAIAPTAAKRGVGDPNTGLVPGSLGAFYIDNANSATWFRTNTVWVKISP